MARLSYLSRELSIRLAQDPQLAGLSVVAVDPGAMPSGLTRRDTWLRRFVIGHLVLRVVAFISVLLRPNGAFRTTQKSAGDVLRAAFDPVAIGPVSGGIQNGVYLNGSEVSDVGAEAKDAVKCRRLWARSLEYAGIREGGPSWTAPIAP